MLLLTMVYVAVFAYLKPYRSFYINVLEVFTLVDIMLQLTIASTHHLKVNTTDNEVLSAMHLMPALIPCIGSNI